MLGCSEWLPLETYIKQHHISTFTINLPHWCHINIKMMSYHFETRRKKDRMDRYNLQKQHAVIRNQVENYIE